MKLSEGLPASPALPAAVAISFVVHAAFVTGAVQPVAVGIAFASVAASTASASIALVEYLPVLGLHIHDCPMLRVAVHHLSGGSAHLHILALDFDHGGTSPGVVNSASVHAQLLDHGSRNRVAEEYPRRSHRATR